METTLQSIRLSPEMVVLLLLGVLLLWQMQATKAEVQAAKAEVQATKADVKTEIAGLAAKTDGLQASLQDFRADHGVALSKELYDMLHTATFAILDTQGHPICCGFFVTPCGVALTAAHDLFASTRKQGKTRRFVRAVDFRDAEFDLEIVEKTVGELDIAVLQLRTLPGSPLHRLALPSIGSLQPSHLREAPVHLVHGNIAYHQQEKAVQLGQDRGYIVAVKPTCVHYSVSTMSGHSGAALILHVIFRGKQLIALHTEGVNDVPDEFSHSSPSTHGDGIRLDLPSIHAAVQKHTR